MDAELNLSNIFYDFGIDDYNHTIKCINAQFLASTKREISIPQNGQKQDLRQKINQLNTDLYEFHEDDTTFNSFFIRNESSNRLFVILSGARNSNESATLFRRWTYYPYINQNVLLIADPGLEKLSRSGLLLNWYLCNDGGLDKYYQLMSSVIRKIAQFLAIDEKNITIFGSSGGGYAALQISSYLKGSTHMAINPQIYLGKYSYFKYFQKITAISSQSLSALPSFDKVEERKDNLYFIAQNMDDESDCRNHFFPFLKRNNIDKVHIGLNCFNNLLLWVYKATGGHGTQGDQFLFSFFLHWVSKFINRELNVDDISTSQLIALMFKKNAELIELAKINISKSKS